MSHVDGQIKYIEKEKDYASKGAAYGISIPALVAGGLALAQNGNLPFIGGGNDKYVNKDALAMSNKLAEKDAEISGLKTQVVIDGKLTEVIEYFNRENKDIRNVAYENACKAAVNEERFNCLKEQVQEMRRDVKHNSDQIHAQATINAITAGKLGCIEEQVQTLNGLWTPKIPARNICETSIPVTIEGITAAFNQAVKSA